MGQLHVGIVGFCNPFELRDFLYHKEDVVSINPATTSVFTYAKELLIQNNKVSVFSSYEGCGKIIEYLGPNLHVYLVPRKFFIKKLSFLSPLYFSRRLYKVIKSHLEGIDVLHAQWTYDFALAAKCFAAELPVFCTVRDWCPYILSLQKKMIPYLYWRLCYRNFLKVMRDERIHFIANSKYTYDCIMQKYSNKYVDIIPNPIQKEWVIASPSLNKKSDSFITICQSVDETRKNIITLLRSFKLYKQRHLEASLLIVGKVSENSSLLKVAERENLLNGVTFLGKVFHQEIIRYIDESSCLVHPSLEETFGNILLEAMARRTICIGGKKSGAVPQVLEYGKFGILCDVTNPEELCMAMEKSQNLVLSQKMSSLAFEKIKNTYQSDINMLNTICVYKKYLSH